MDLMRLLQTFKYRKHANEKSYDWKWNEKGFNRIAVVNCLISNTHGLNSSYLEIGCASDELFNSVACYDKVGVDPNTGGTHRMTSDQFFMSNEKHFDVIFIDGLHEYPQVRKDAFNALSFLEDSGWIAFHDFLPSNWKEQHVPRISNAWTGDCWKFALELMQGTGIEFKIIEVDCGVGLLRKTCSSWKIPNLSNELATANFGTFVKAKERLPIISFKDAMRVIGKT